MIQYADGTYTRKSWLIKPEPFEFHPFNIEIHGITPQMVGNAPTFKEVWHEISDVLESNIVVAHNAAFDMSVIRYSLDQYNLRYPSIDYLCTLKLVQKAMPELMNHKLPSVARHIGYTFTHHDALEDAQAAAEVLLNLIHDHGHDSIEEMARGYGVRLGKIYSGGYVPCSVKTFRSNSYSRLDATKLRSDNDEFDKANLLYGKTVVFTGSLIAFTRAEAAQLVVNAGGKTSNSVNQKTDFLIMGDQDVTALTDGRTSSKVRKAIELIEKGHHIRIVSESEFREGIRSCR